MIAEPDTHELTSVGNGVSYFFQSTSVGRMLTKLSVLGGAAFFIYIGISSAAGVTGVNDRSVLQACSSNVQSWVLLSSNTMQLADLHYYAVRFAKVRLACKNTGVFEGNGSNSGYRAAPAVAELAGNARVMEEAAILFSNER